MRIADIMFSIPPLVLAIAIAAVLGAGTTNIVLAIGIVYAPAFARTIRAPVLVAKETQYVDAARTLGAGSGRIILRHILPNVAAPLIVQTTFSLSTAILTESSLSFVGLGTQPPDPSWGAILNGSRTFMELAWWLAVFPGAAIMLVVIGFNLMGDGLRDVLDPRLRIGGK
jgi:peptide/nickel transport system permease protein